MKSLFVSLSLPLLLLMTLIAKADQRPNVLLLYIDDLRPQTSDYGHSFMRTPSFQQLATDGVRFENAYCQVPTCGASRASLFTSLYPTTERFPNFHTWAEKDAAGVKTLPQRFKEAGYTTISNGKVFHHVEDTNERSWSEPAWRPDTNGRTYYNDASKAWKARRKQTFSGPQQKNARKKDLMWEIGDVDAMQTHDGKIELAKHRELPDPMPAGYRDVKEQFAYVPMTPDLSREVSYNSDEYHRRMRQGYYASVTHADDLTGRIFATMDQLGLTGNTIVVTIGDHGWLLGEHDRWAKNQLLHEALRTAMWMKGPGIAKNASIASHVEFVDIHPTLCELAGIEIDEKIHGKSFANVLKRPSATHRDEAYTRFEGGDALTTKDFFYVKWSANQENGELLIDRENDPLHKANVAENKLYKKRLDALRKKLQSRIDLAVSFETLYEDSQLNVNQPKTK